MTFTEAAIMVLRLVGKPLHYKEVTEVAVERSLLSHVGKSPEVTMGARLAAQVKKGGTENPLKRVKPGVFALTDWDDAAVDKGLADKRSALEIVRALPVEDEAESISDASEETSQEADEAEAVAEKEPVASHKKLGSEAPPPDEEERHRAELSAGASAFFEDEDDDDQPLLGPDAQARSRRSPDDEEEEKGDGRRKRRRRRPRTRQEENDEQDSEDQGDDRDERDDRDEPEERGARGRSRQGRQSREPRGERGQRRGRRGASSDDDDELPGYTVSDADDSQSYDERSSDEGSPGTEGTLADLMEDSLSRRDRGRGMLTGQSLADLLRRKHRFEQNITGGTLLAVAHSENLLSQRRSGVARFKISGNKIGVWAGGQDRRHQDRKRSLERTARDFNEAALKILAEQIGRLPQRALGELVSALLEQMGVNDLQSVTRAGAHGCELHFSARLKLAGVDPFTGGAAQLTSAIVVRRDGKDIGRERVTELRGGLHHYGPAAHGWLISSGQVLSGAKEEARATGASPVTLTGKHELAELCLAHGLGVSTFKVEVPIVDFELFESLSSR